MHTISLITHHLASYSSFCHQGLSRGCCEEPTALRPVSGVQDDLRREEASPCESVHLCIQISPSTWYPQHSMRSRPASGMEPQIRVIGHFMGELVVLDIVTPHKYLWAWNLSTHLSTLLTQISTPVNYNAQLTYWYPPMWTKISLS